MMKEWKNNPESDDDTKTEETEQRTEEKLNSNQIRGKARNVNYSPSAKTAKQVGGWLLQAPGLARSLTGHWDTGL